MRKSKKAKVFELFNQGFTPSSPEVKAVGLHSSNRYKYFYAWEKLGKPSAPPPRKGSLSTISSSKPSGETIGGIDETIAKPRVQRPKVKPEETLAPEEQILLPGVGEGEVLKTTTTGTSEPIGVGEDPEPEIWPEDIPREQARAREKASAETIGTVSEVVTPKSKDGKTVLPDQKMATTIVEDGIKCTVLLSLQTLTLYSIAKSTQAQFSDYGDDDLLLGDFLDTCAEDFFKARGKKLGLIDLGAKNSG